MNMKPQLTNLNSPEELFAAWQLRERMRAFHEREIASVPLDIRFWGRLGWKVALTVSALEWSVTVQGAQLQRADDKPMTEEYLYLQLLELGGTPFFARDIEIELSRGAFMPLGAVGELRRRAVDKLVWVLCDLAQAQ